MLALMISVVLLNYVQVSIGTRLPLEVLDLPQTSSPSPASPPSSSSTTTTTKTATAAGELRRSRQMLDILQHQHHQQQPQPQEHHPLQSLGSNFQTVHETRILYQVGSSEEDLPICAPNAICSKIDLYGTPWLERQCRCPTTSPHMISHQIQKNIADYYDVVAAEGDDVISNNKVVDTVTIRRLMKKLGAVHREDISLEEDDDNMEDNIVYHHKHSKNHHHQRHYGHHSSHYKHNNNKVATVAASMGNNLPNISGCPIGLGVDDGHTISDKTRHYKLCNPVYGLPVCRYFRDYTWSLTTSPNMNTTEQVVHCRCPKNSVTYLTKREAARGGYTYYFACSPQTRLRCQRKEPCKLFTVRKRQESVDEVNTNSLCQCPRGHSCPRHHKDLGVIAGETFAEDNIQTYSSYCMAND